MYFSLTCTSPPIAMERSFHDELIAPRLLNAQISPHTEAVFLKALAVNAEHRFASMYEFASALHYPFAAYSPPAFTANLVQAAGAQTERVILPAPPPSFVSAPPPPYSVPLQSRPARPPGAVQSRPVPGGAMYAPVGRSQPATPPLYPMLPPRRTAPP